MKEGICPYCQGPVLRKGKFCCNRCYRQWWQNNLKYLNPTQYQKRLELARKSCRKKVRLRRGLPEDYPSLLSPNHGKGWKMKDGYKQLLIKNHPNAAKNGYVMEHIVILSKHIGRPLRKGETVHHKNGIRDDNRLENLELWIDTCRQGQRASDRFSHAIHLLESYGCKIVKSDFVHQLLQGINGIAQNQ